MDELQGIELRRLNEYLASSSDEVELATWLSVSREGVTLIVVEGFEERSVGILESFALESARVDQVVIVEYPPAEGSNSKYRQRFDEASAKIAPGRTTRIQHDNSGQWAFEALRRSQSTDVVIDITGLSNRALFGALDATGTYEGKVHLAYSEAAEYFPRLEDWQRLQPELQGTRSLADVVDGLSWLYGTNYQVELIPSHEGYDSAGSSRALLGFLAFKGARIAAVVGQGEYSACMYIAGEPRLTENHWRLDALKKINESTVKNWPVVEMSTFGYRNALRDLTRLLFCEKEPMLEKYDVHLAILGSKLQGVACWILSSIVPAITVLTSVPVQYFPDAFSTGVGSRWVIDLAQPLP